MVAGHGRTLILRIVGLLILLLIRLRLIGKLLIELFLFGKLLVGLFAEILILVIHRSKICYYC